ncbi:MAG: phosphatidate cytidylyltransferase [Candidatus Glassbacteria bacterium]|nr:phosphatidate cytidylyltransferase [Candidatus Glassbacteria bacterium]
MNLLLRSLVAAVGIPAIYFLARWGSWYFVVFVAAQSALAAHEFFRIAQSKGLRPLAWIGTPAAGLLPVSAFIWLSLQRPGWFLAAGFAAVALVCLAALFRENATDQALAGMSATVFGIIYLGGFLSLQVVLRHDPRFSDLEGFCWVFLTYLLTWSVDVGSYLFGSLFGRHKLCPRLSPGKTIEGFIGGMLLVVAVSYLAGSRLMELFDSSGALAFGLLVGLAAPAGDLVESLFKRDAGLKDSSGLIPGHGGVLDRFDSLVLTLPAAVVFRALIG